MFIVLTFGSAHCKLLQARNLVLSLINHKNQCLSAYVLGANEEVLDFAGKSQVLPLKLCGRHQH